jgi:hypothetical protein
MRRFRIRFNKEYCISSDSPWKTGFCPNDELLNVTFLNFRPKGKETRSEDDLKIKSDEFTELSSLLRTVSAGKSTYKKIVVMQIP